MAFSSSRRWLVVAALALGASACLSPTLPLPPPSQPDVSIPDKDGNVSLTGTASANAIVYAYNDRTENGSITTADPGGYYKMKIAAQNGDDIELWQELGSDRSASIIFTVKPK